MSTSCDSDALHLPAPPSTYHTSCASDAAALAAAAEALTVALAAALVAALAAAHGRMGRLMLSFSFQYVFVIPGVGMAPKGPAQVIK